MWCKLSKLRCQMFLFWERKIVDFRLRVYLDNFILTKTFFQFFLPYFLSAPQASILKGEVIAMLFIFNQSTRLSLTCDSWIGGAGQCEMEIVSKKLRVNSSYWRRLPSISCLLHFHRKIFVVTILTYNYKPKIIYCSESLSPKTNLW